MANWEYYTEKPIKNFYFQPKVPFLEDPEKQRTYRKKYLADITQSPEPEPLILLGDILHKQVLDTIGDRSCPSIVKNDLADFFKRRLA